MEQVETFLLCGMSDLRIGDHLTFNGRTYVLRGFEPMSLPSRSAELEDVISGKRIRVPLADLPATPGDDGHSLSPIRQHRDRGQPGSRDSR
jgi:hypothetical protein